MTKIDTAFSLPQIVAIAASLHEGGASTGAILAMVLQVIGAAPDQVQQVTGASERTLRRYRSEVAAIRSNLTVAYTTTTESVSDLDSGSEPERAETQAARAPEGSPPRPKRAKKADQPGQIWPPAQPIVPVTPEADFLARCYAAQIPGATVRQVGDAIMGALVGPEGHATMPEEQLHQAVMLAALNTYQRDQDVRAGRARWFSPGAPLNWFAAVLARMCDRVAARARRQTGAAEATGPVVQLRYSTVLLCYLDDRNNRYKDPEGQVPLARTGTI